MLSRRNQILWIASFFCLSTACKNRGHSSLESEAQAAGSNSAGLFCAASVVNDINPRQVFGHDEWEAQPKMGTDHAVDIFQIFVSNGMASKPQEIWIRIGFPAGDKGISRVLRVYGPFDTSQARLVIDDSMSVANEQGGKAFYLQCAFGKVPVIVPSTGEHGAAPPAMPSSTPGAHGAAPPAMRQ